MQQMGKPRHTTWSRSQLQKVDRKMSRRFMESHNGIDGEASPHHAVTIAELQ